MTAIERLIATAEAEVGYLEKASNQNLDSDTENAGKANWNKYARDLDALGDFYNGRKNGYDWCDVFTDWVFVQTFGKDTALKLLCAPIKSCGAGCKYSALYYKGKNQYHKSNPRPGDQIFFGDGKSMWHTGLVVDIKNGRVYTIEGNTSGASGVVSNGGGVAKKSYNLNYQYIDGYGRPDYSIIEEDDEDMTQEKFNEMMNNYLAELGKEEPSSWSKEEREWAEEVGLIKGNASGEKLYKAFCTREQMVVFLKRLSDIVC